LQVFWLLEVAQCIASVLVARSRTVYCKCFGC